MGDPKDGHQRGLDRRIKPWTPEELHLVSGKMFLSIDPPQPGGDRGVKQLWFHTDDGRLILIAEGEVL
jgi:hypothetical protein